MQKSFRIDIRISISIRVLTTNVTVPRSRCIFPSCFFLFVSKKLIYLQSLIYHFEYKLNKYRRIKNKIFHPQRCIQTILRQKTSVSDKISRPKLRKKKKEKNTGALITPGNMILFHVICIRSFHSPASFLKSFHKNLKKNSPILIQLIRKRNLIRLNVRSPKQK